jgi:hypothetical protein
MNAPKICPTPPPQASKAPTLLIRDVPLWVHSTYMITPSTQASISQVQASMQVIQVCPCHLGLNTLLHNAQRSSSKSKHPHKKATNLHVANMKNVTKLSKCLQHSKKESHTSIHTRSSNPRASHLHMCMFFTEQALHITSHEAPLSMV